MKDYKTEKKYSGDYLGFLVNKNKNFNKLITEPLNQFIYKTIYQKYIHTKKQSQLN